MNIYKKFGLGLLIILFLTISANFILSLSSNKYYNFNYEMKSLVSRQGTISIGDKMSCIIESVHPYEGKISLIPA